MDCRSVLFLGESWPGDAVGRSTRSPAIARFDPAAPTEEQMWFPYTPANSPLIMSDVRSLALDSHGNLWLSNVNAQTSNGAAFRFNPTSNVWTRYAVGQGLPRVVPAMDLSRSQAIKAARGHTPAASARSMARPGRIHACQFAADALAGSCGRLRRERQPLG